MSFFRGFSIVMSANIAMFALTFINNKLIYLLLPEEDNGVYFLVMRLVIFMSLLFGEWLRLSNMNIGGKDSSLVPRLSGNAFWYLASIVVLFVGGSYAFGQMYTGAFFGLPFRMLPIVIVIGGALIARNVWQSMLLFGENMAHYGCVILLWAFLFLFFDVLFLVVLKRGLNSVILALIISTVISSLWAFFISWSKNGHVFSVSGVLFRESLSLGARAWIAVIGISIMTNVSALTIEYFSGPEQNALYMVAIFSVGFRVFSLFQRAANVAGTVLLSHVVQRDKTSGANMTVVVTRNIIMLSLLMSLGVIILGKAVVVIVASSRYLSSYVPLLVMLPGIISINAGSTLNGYYWGNEYPTDVILAPFAASILGIVLNALLIPRIGVMGASLSFSIMCSVWFVFQATRFAREAQFPLSDVLVPKLADYEKILSRVRGLRKK